jgi:hypothetical protein
MYRRNTPRILDAQASWRYGMKHIKKISVARADTVSDILNSIFRWIQDFVFLLKNA